MSSCMSYALHLIKLSGTPDTSSLHMPLKEGKPTPAGDTSTGYQPVARCGQNIRAFGEGNESTACEPSSCLRARSGGQDICKPGFSLSSEPATCSACISMQSAAVSQLSEHHLIWDRQAAT